MSNMSFSRLIIVLGVIAVSACNSIDVSKRMQDASNYLSKGQYRKAGIELKNILNKEPGNIQARKMLGDVYLKVYEGASAEKEYLRFSEYGGDKKEILLDLSRALYIQGKYKNVISEISDESITKDNGRLALLKGEAYLGLGDLQTSATYFRKALRINKNLVDAELSLIKLELVEKNYNSAISKLKSIVKRHGENAKTRFLLGLALEKTGDDKESINAYKKSLELYKGKRLGQETFNVHLAYVNSLLRMKQMEEAGKQVNIFLNLYPNHPIAKYTFALYSYMEGNLDKAELYLHKVIEIAPDHMPSILLLGSINYAKGNYEQANEFLSHYVNEIPTHIQARRLLASVRLKLNRGKDALSVLRDIEPDKQDAEILAMIGQIAISSGNLDMGIKNLREATGKKPGDIQIRKALALAYLEKGQYDQVIQELQELGDDDKSQSKYILIDAYLRKGNYQKAQNEADDLLEQYPQDNRALTTAGIVHLYAGNRTQSRKYFMQAIATSKEGFLPATLLLARMNLEDGHFVEARRQFDEVLLKDPENISALLGLAQLSERTGKPDAALILVKKAHQKNKQAVLPALLLGRFYLKARKFQDALSTLLPAYEKHDNNLQLMLFLARAYRYSGDLGKALKLYKKVVGKSDVQLVILEMAELQFKMGLRKEAKLTLKKGVSVSKQSMLSRGVLGMAELQEGNVDQAMIIAKQIMKDDRESWVGYSLAGDILLFRKKYRNAQGYFKKALEISGNKRELYRLYNAYILDKNKGKGINLLETWLKNNPKDKDVLFDLANLKMVSNDEKTSVSLYKRVLELEPKHIGSLNNLANLYIDSDPSRALSYAKKVYALNNTNPTVQDTLGWAYLKNGDTEKALQLIHQAAKRTNSTEIQYHLAVALSQVGRKVESKRILEKLLKNKGFTRDADKARTLLKELE